MKTIGTIICAIAVSLSISSDTVAEPVLDEFIESRISIYKEKYEENRVNRALTPEKLNTLAYEVFDGLDIPDLTFEQLAMLGGAGLFDRAPKDCADDAVKLLDIFASENNVDGARAAIFSAQLSMTAMYDLDSVIKKFGTMFSHPSISEAMETDAAVMLFESLQRLEVDLSSIKDEMVMFGMGITPDFYADAAPIATSYFMKLQVIASEKETAAIHTNLMTWAQAAKGKISNPSMLRFLEGQISFMNSAFARGKLIGYPAPELNFIWSSDGTTSKLSDHKGKVVVLDFWATWCGPCIASFPEIVKLTELYEGYPVEIIGVTSLQGRHYGKDGKVETNGDSNKEFELMSSYIEWKGITWDIAFSKEKVYNPEYGVQGIPHVAIIDAQGKTRYNKVRSFDEQVKLINGLLKEANLRHPQAD